MTAVKVHLALGFIDMRKGIDGLAMLVQGVLQQDPFTGHLFLFRGRTRANLIKIVFWDGTGLCLFTKRLEHGVFLWPSNVEAGGTLMLTSAQYPSLSSSPWMRGAPQSGFSTLIRRINTRSSLSIGGRPPSGRHLQRQ